MKRKPVVAVVGRPNVGKSTFFNKMVGRRISIEENTPGVTRDRIYSDVNWLNYQFTLIDTGGIELDTNDIILSQMREQAQLAIDSADVIIFMIDGREILTSADYEVSEMLRRSSKKIILVANKIDTARMPEHFYDFYELGLGEPVAISSANGLNFGDLLDMVVEDFEPISEDEEEKDTIYVAIVGKPNVGKSSLLNAILGEKRVIVSPIAGTTRESIDTEIVIDDKKYVFIDTAGLRKKGKISDDVEKYSSFRSLSSVDRADVCLIMIDAQEGITEQDTKIAGYAHNQGKASIILVNKWDLIEKDNKTYKEFEKKIKDKLPFMQYAPVEMVSILKNQRLNNIVGMIDYVHNQSCMRVSTGALNDVISEAVMMHQVPTDKGKALKIFYATQVSVKPPRFILFINSVELAHFSYIRYIENQIRANFSFDGTPIVIELRERKKSFD